MNLSVANFLSFPDDLFDARSFFSCLYKGIEGGLSLLLGIVEALDTQHPALATTVFSVLEEQLAKLPMLSLSQDSKVSYLVLARCLSSAVSCSDGAATTTLSSRTDSGKQGALGFCVRQVEYLLRPNFQCGYCGVKIAEFSISLSVQVGIEPWIAVNDAFKCPAVGGSV